MDRRRSLLKIAALRSERERQAGVKMGYDQSITSAAVTALIGSPVSIGTGDFTLEYFGNSDGSKTVYSSFMFNAAHRDVYSTGSLFVYSVSGKGVGWIVFEKPSSGDPLLDSIDLITGETGTPFHFVLTRKGTTVKAYFNGELKATKEQSAVKDLGDFRLGMANSSNMVMSRIYNYALSAEEVAALYNDGDPAGYVLPGMMKGLMPVEIVGENSHTWTGVDDSNYSHIVRVSRPFTIGQLYKIRFIVSNWEAGNNPFIKIGTTGSYYLPDFNGNGTYEIYATPNGTPYSGVYVYAGLLNTDRRMTITVDSIEPVGCIAEYLPQNLVRSPHDDPVEIVGENSYTWTGVDSPYSHSVALSRKLSTDSFYRVKITVSDYESGIPDFKISANNTTKIPAANGTYAFDVQVKGTPYPYVLVYAGPTGSDRRVTITVDSIEPIPGVAISWLDSAKQLPLNDEYLPPLFESIVIGDATPIHITGKNSYTWTGVDAPVSFNIKINRVLSVGGAFRITGSVSNYKSGTPYLNLGNSSIAYLPKDNSPFTLVVTLKEGSSTLLPYIYIYGGSSSEDKQLTITVDSIEPIVEHSYDLTANGTPQIIK